MTYHGNETENHVGSRVRYFHGGKWKEGTLLAPVNYQIVTTKEYGSEILSTGEPYGECIVPEVKSVSITDACIISENEAKEIIRLFKNNSRV